MRIESAHKVRKETFVFHNVAVIVQLLWGQNRYGLVWAVMINPPELPINDEARNYAHIASTGVRLHKRTPKDATSKNVTGSEWRIKKSTKSSNLIRAVLKFSSENQLNVRNSLSILCVIFPLIARSGKSYVTISLVVCKPHTCRSLVLKNVRITGIGVRKNQCCQKKFLKIISMQHVFVALQ